MQFFASARHCCHQLIERCLSRVKLVRVCDGPFADTTVPLKKWIMKEPRIKVSVMIFGRSTPVELDLIKLKKLIKITIKNRSLE